MIHAESIPEDRQRLLPLLHSGASYAVAPPKSSANIETFRHNSATFCRYFPLDWQPELAVVTPWVLRPAPCATCCSLSRSLALPP